MGKGPRLLMSTAAGAPLHLALALGLTLSACVVIDPTQTTTEMTDATSDVTSSTTERSASEPAPAARRKEQKVRAFAAVNFERLKEDMALGQGEHLASLATLLGVPEGDRAAFFAFAQRRFPLVYPSPAVTPDELIAALTSELAAHPRFTRVVASR